VLASSESIESITTTDHFSSSPASCCPSPNLSVGVFLLWRLFTQEKTNNLLVGQLLFVSHMGCWYVQATCVQPNTCTVVIDDRVFQRSVCDIMCHQCFEFELQNQAQFLVYEPNLFSRPESLDYTLEKKNNARWRALSFVREANIFCPSKPPTCGRHTQVVERTSSYLARTQKSNEEKRPRRQQSERKARKPGSPVQRPVF
jgi:hypothetical protein